jgi:hypothetical protein
MRWLSAARAPSFIRLHRVGCPDEEAGEGDGQGVGGLGTRVAWWAKG